MNHPLVRQVLAAMIQRRPFAALRPSPLFSGWTSATVAAVLAAVPSLLFPTPRSVGRQFTSRHRSPLKTPLDPRRRLGLDPAGVRLGLSKSLEFYSWLHSHCGFPHDELTCRSMSISLAKSHSPKTLWRFLRRNKSLVTTTTVTSIIDALGKEGLAHDALTAFYRLRQLHCEPDVVSYNTLISALCRVGNLKKARFILEQMELPGARCPPDKYTYTILIATYCKRSLETGCRKAIRRRMWEANRMFRRMLFMGFDPDVVTYNCLIDGLCKTYRIDRARELFDEMLLKGCSPNCVTYNSFIRYYSVVNEVDKAVEMMRGMVERNHRLPTSSSYTPIVHALVETGRVEEARDMVEEMVSRGSIPREFTYKLVRGTGEVGLPAEVCKRIEDGMDARFRRRMLVKPLMSRKI